MKIYLSWTDPQCPNLNLGSFGSSKVSQHAQNSIRSKNLRASLCKILISSFAHKMDFAHNFSVDFF